MGTSSVSRTVSVGDGLRLVEKSYPAGLRMGRHAHDEWRYCLAVAGSYTDSWRRGYRTRSPRQLSLHPADESHTSIFHSPVVCFHIEFAGAWRARLLGEAGITAEPHEFLAGRVPLLAEQLRDECARRDTSSHLVLEGLACELIGWSARTIRHERPGASWVYQARELVRDRFTETLTLAEIAAAVRVHPVHLARQFRRTFGCSIGEYVRRARVGFVCAELTTNAPLSDIALSAGFSDQSHMTRVFKHATGLTPSRYRQRR